MYQTIILIGNLGKDPEMRFTPSGQPVTTLSVATNRRYNGQNGQPVKETTWFRVTVWGKQAESCNEFLHKGSRNSPGFLFELVECLLFGDITIHGDSIPILAYDRGGGRR